MNNKAIVVAVVCLLLAGPSRGYAQSQVRVVVGEHKVEDYLSALRDPVWHNSVAMSLAGSVSQANWSRAQFDSLTVGAMEVLAELDGTVREDRSTAFGVLAFLKREANDGEPVGRFEHFRQLFEDFELFHTSFKIMQMGVLADTDPRAISFLVRVAEGRHEKSNENPMVPISALETLAASEAGRGQLRRMSVEETVRDPDARDYLSRLARRDFHPLRGGEF